MTATVTVTPLNNEGSPPSDGVTSVSLANSGGGSIDPTASDNGDGSFSGLLTAANLPGTDTVTASVDAGGVVVELSQRPVITYYRCGDIDGNLADLVDIADLVYLVDYMFNGGPEPPIPGAVDVDGSGGELNIADLVYLVDFMFNDGPSPVCL
jgi:hypothetical protein